jgi:type VI secretion system protein ImpE
MSSTELLAAGQLDDAIAAATEEVKKAPRNVHARIFLFELLAAAGQWERAQKHLDVLADQEEKMVEGIASYRGVLDAERLRARLFTTGQGEPQQVTLAPAEAGPRLTALRHLVAGELPDAKRLLDEAEAARPALRGVADGTPFDDVRDADDLLAGVIEVISQGRYGWLPVNRIRRLELDPPKLFRDTLWAAATITLTDGMTAKMLLPTRYPGSESQADPQLRLGRTTDWVDRGGVVRGVGQRTLVLGEEARTLLEIRELTVEG